MNEKKYNKNISINIPEAVKQIIRTIQDNGFDAYAVGGCVRDSVLNKVPKDWDITTSAKPEEVKKLFRRTIDTGIKHGTVTVMIKGTGYEVTTYRIDGEYNDGRHPENVTFTSSLEEDLKRRDFTINAMAYNDETGIVDCFGGIDDLNNGIIRCVGDATERFTEDALRMLRAVRFSAVLGFAIEECTRNAIIKLAPSITKISRERIQAELDKLIMSDHPDRITEVYDTGLMHCIFTGSHLPEDFGEEKSALASALTTSPKNHFIRWALFISFVSADNILQSLKFDNNTIKICTRMVKYQSEQLPESESDLRRFIVKIGKDIFGSYYLTFRDILNNIDKQHLNDIRCMYDLITNRGDCLSLKELKINGADLLSMGITPGKRMGDILNYLFDVVLDDYRLNDKDTLLELAKNYT